MESVMAKRKKIEVKFWCPKCKIEAPIDKEKSNENWTIYKTVCDKCGGKTEMAIKD
jgi:transcription elongation factor Elf1